MKTKIILIAVAASMFLGARPSYPISPVEVFKAFFAVSTTELEELKKDALSKVFEYDYKRCYEKTLALTEKIPDTQIYAKKKDMIAVYCSALNSTPVGIFFEEIDASHTKVLISSASSRAKEWIASNVFSEKIQKPIERFTI